MITTASVLNQIETSQAGRTAIVRRNTTLPLRTWVAESYDPLFFKTRSVLHFGAGKAFLDDEWLQHVSKSFARFDPNHGSSQGWDQRTYDVVICTYVLNTLPPTMRERVWDRLREMLSPRGVVLVAVRGDKAKGTPDEDGVRTSRGTFQKQFTRDTLKMEGTRHFGNVSVFRKGHAIYAECRAIDWRT